MALLYDELESALQPLDQPWEAVFVDDGSTDGSYAALTRLHNAQDNIRVIRLRRNATGSVNKRNRPDSASAATP